MKKSIIYLCLIVLVSMVTFSCQNTNDTDVKYETEIVANEVTINEILPYENSQSLDDIFLEYNIIETNTGKEIIFNDFTTYKITDIYYVIDSELKIKGEQQLSNNKERMVVPCSQDMYNSIKETELLYEHDDKSIHYYKETDSGTLYRKIVIYNTSNNSS